MKLEKNESIENIHRPSALNLRTHFLSFPCISQTSPYANEIALFLLSKLIIQQFSTKSFTLALNCYVVGLNLELEIPLPFCSATSFFFVSPFRKLHKKSCQYLLSISTPTFSYSSLFRFHSYHSI